MTRLERSLSVTVRLPLVLNPESVSVKPKLSGPSLITGASLVPVMVMVTVSVAVAPWLSVAVIVKVSVTVSPVARKSRLALLTV